MIKYLKSEVYKILCGNFLFFTFVVVFGYCILVSQLYLSDGLDFNYLFTYFNEEFIVLYLTLSLFFSSSLIADEYLYGTIYDIKSQKLLWAKMVVLLVYLFLIFILALLFLYDISIFLSQNQFIQWSVILKVIYGFLKVLPMIIIVNLICLLTSVILKKSNMALIVSYSIYLILEYLKNIIISKDIKSLYFLPMFNWNLNARTFIENYLSIGHSLAICFFTVLILLFLVIYIFKKRS